MQQRRKIHTFRLQFSNFLMFGTPATPTLMRQSPIPLAIDDSTLLGTRFSGHNKAGKEGR
jgi:hypothetical protein